MLAGWTTTEIAPLADRVDFQRLIVVTMVVTSGRLALAIHARDIAALQGLQRACRDGALHGSVRFSVGDLQKGSASLAAWWACRCLSRPHEQLLAGAAMVEYSIVRAEAQKPFFIAIIPTVPQSVSSVAHLHPTPLLARAMTRTMKARLKPDQKCVERLQQAFDQAYEACDYAIALRELRAVATTMGRPELAALIRASDPPFASVYKVLKALGFKLVPQKAA